MFSSQRIDQSSRDQNGQVPRASETPWFWLFLALPPRPGQRLAVLLDIAVGTATFLSPEFDHEDIVGNTANLTNVCASS